MSELKAEIEDLKLMLGDLYANYCRQGRAIEQLVEANANLAAELGQLRAQHSVEPEAVKGEKEESDE